MINPNTLQIYKTLKTLFDELYNNQGLVGISHPGYSWGDIQMNAETFTRWFASYETKETGNESIPLILTAEAGGVKFYTLTSQGEIDYLAEERRREEREAYEEERFEERRVS